VLTVDLSWLYAIPDAVSGIASVTVDTYMDDVKTGTVTKYFSIRAGAGILPALIGLSADMINNGVPSIWGIYVQEISGVRLTGQGIAGSYGSWITEIKMTGGGYQGNGSPYETGPVNAAGLVPFVCEVTDSRGRKKTASVNVTFVAYARPQIIDLDVARCNPDGTPNDSGEYAKVTPEYSFSNLDGKNPIDSMITSRRLFAGGEYVQVDTYIAASGEAFVEGSGYDANSSYVIKVAIADEFNSVEAVAILPTQQVLLNYRVGGRGVAFGMIAQRIDAVEINPAWEFYYKGMTLDERFGGIDIPSIWPVTSGGIGLGEVAAGSYLKGNGTGALVPRTPAQVRADIESASSKIFSSEAALNAELENGFFKRTDYNQIGFTIAKDSTFKLRLLHMAESDAFYFQSYSGGAWQTARKILHDGNIGNITVPMTFQGQITPLRLDNPTSAYSTMRFTNSQGAWHLGTSINDLGAAFFGIGFSTGPVVYWDYLGYQYPKNSIYFGSNWLGNRGSWNQPTRGAITQLIDNTGSQGSVIVGADANGIRHYGIDLLNATTNRIMRLYVGDGYAEINQGGVLITSNLIMEAGTFLINKYLGIGAKAADSNLLDGLDNTAFVAFKNWVPYPGIDANLVDNYVSFSYANNAPWIGPLVHFNPNGYGLMFSASYNIAGKLSFRTRNGDAAAYQPWNEIYHTGNIRNGQAGPGSGAEGDIYLQW
jgi:hypothetical protein